jgi:tight adherence protein B
VVVGVNAALLTLAGVMAAAACARVALVSGRRVGLRARLITPRVGRGDPWRRLEEVARRRWEARPSAHRHAVLAGLPGLLEEVARSLRSGSSVRQAVQEASHLVGPAAAGLRAALDRAVRGEPLDTALAQWAHTAPVPEVRLAVAALELAAGSGGDAARAVDGVAATLRERRAVADELAGQSIQARLSAVVIAVLPGVFAAWCVATDDRAASFLLATPAGWLCLTLGLGLLATGAWWMRRIIRSAA